MKVTKTVKYRCILTEETLEKDIEEFIKDARRGDFSWDAKHGSFGLRIIKQYFKLLQNKFDNNELTECMECYHRLILFLLDSSTGKDKANFGYDDLLAKTSNNFDEFINNYFTCLVNVCNLEELAEKIAEYASKLQGYGFEPDKIILLKKLNQEQLNKLEQRILVKVTGMTEKDEDKQDILHFLIGLAEKQRDRDKYMQLVSKFEGVLDKEELECLREEYE